MPPEIDKKNNLHPSKIERKKILIIKHGEKWQTEENIIHPVRHDPEKWPVQVDRIHTQEHGHPVVRAQKTNIERNIKKTSGNPNKATIPRLLEKKKRQKPSTQHPVKYAKQELKTKLYSKIKSRRLRLQDKPAYYAGHKS